MVEFAPASENVSPLLTEKEEAPSFPLAGNSKRVFEQTVQDLIEEMTERVKKDRNAIDDYILLGRLYRIQGNSGRALRLHQNLLAHDISDRKLEAKLYSELGMDLLQARVDDCGERYFQKALSLDKNFVAALRGLALTYEARDDYASAAKIQKRLGQLLPEEKRRLSFIYARLAKQQLDLGEHVPARRSVEEATRADANNPYAQLILAEVYMATARFDKAIDLLSRFLSTWPKLSFMALRKLEDAHYQRDTFAELEGTLREAVRLQPDNFYILFSLARHLSKKRRKEDAKEFVQKALEAKPSYVNAIKEWVSLHSQPDQEQDLIEVLKPFFAHFKQSRRFICPNCGVSYPSTTWNCTSCGTWDVFNIKYVLPAP